MSLSVLLSLPLVAALTLHLPVDCELGKACFIQNYVDLDPAEDSWQDYTCGPLSYNGHKGTDFRARDIPHMRKGIDVLAAADGKVRAIRDGMPDSSIRDSGAQAVKHRECGNGVLLEHDNGFQTQYCHLKNGSIAVTKGDTVQAGEVLGQIGLSGQTEFPHLHLEVRDAEGKTLDPFAGPMASTRCADEHTSMWREADRPALAYRPTALLAHGFTAAVPNVDDAREGRFRETQLPVDADAIIFWVDLMGARAGDTLELVLKDPDGAHFVNHAKRLQKNKAAYFQYIGKRRQEETWREGLYSGHVTLTRGEQEAEVIIDEMVTLTVGRPGRKDL